MLQQDARALPLPPGKISVFRDTFLTLLQRGLMRYTCNSSSPFVKVSKKCQKSVTKDFEIFPGRNGSVRFAVKGSPHKNQPAAFWVQNKLISEVY